MIEFDCVTCGSNLRAPDHTAGRNAKCKKCGNGIRIPGVIEPSIAPQASPSNPSSESNPQNCGIDPASDPSALHTGGPTKATSSTPGGDTMPPGSLTPRKTDNSLYMIGFSIAVSVLAGTTFVIPLVWEKLGTDQRSKSSSETRPTPVPSVPEKVANEPDIRQFKIGGVNLNTTLAEFKKLYPDISDLSKPNEKILGLDTHGTSTEKISFLTIQFFDGKARQITGIWVNQAFETTGGNYAPLAHSSNALLDFSADLINKIYEQFGKAEESSPGSKSVKPLDVELYWKNISQKTVLDVTMKDGMTLVTASNFEAQEKLDERKRSMAKSSVDD